SAMGGQVSMAPEADVGKHAVAVIGAKGNVAENSSSLTTIVGDGGCWRAAPNSGERSVEIVLSVSGLKQEVRYSLTLVADPACGPPGNFVVELRDASGGWLTVSGICPAGPEGGKACRLPRGSEMELRLRAAPKQ